MVIKLFRFPLKFPFFFKPNRATNKARSLPRERQQSKVSGRESFT